MLSWGLPCYSRPLSVLYPPPQGPASSSPILLEDWANRTLFGPAGVQPFFCLRTSRPAFARCFDAPFGNLGCSFLFSVLPALFSHSPSEFPAATADSAIPIFAAARSPLSDSHGRKARAFVFSLMPSADCSPFSPSIWTCSTPFFEDTLDVVLQ